MAPAYSFHDFCSACENGRAHLTRGAQITATSDLGLATRDAVLKFIGGGGLESPGWINTLPWENNPDPRNPIDVDSYRFNSGARRGYIAFLFQPKTALWMIKSLKNDDQSGFGKSTAMLLALKKSGLVK